jgi:hypothetical protein
VVAALAKLYSHRGRDIYAAELLGLAYGHPASTADIRADFDSVRAGLGNNLGAETLRAAMERGRNMDLQELAQEIVRGSAGG